MATAPNFEAIKRWFKENRPDISTAVLNGIMENDAYILLMSGAFEAGREFQQRNPEAGKFLEFGKEYK